MSDIRIYLKSEKQGDKSVGTYYMTYFKEGEWCEPPATEEWLEKQRRRAKCLYINRTRMEAYLLTEAIRSIRSRSNIWVFTENDQTWATIKNWMPLWRERNWIKSKGAPVDQEYIDLDRKLKRHTLKDITIGAHEYSVGLETELHALGGAYAGNRNQ